MRFKLDLDLFSGSSLRLAYGVEYILVGSGPIVLSTSDERMDLYHKCVGNGTNEIYFKPTLKSKGDVIWLFYGDLVAPVDVDYNEFVLADHLEDITPAFINEEYPLFRKLMEYYFKYLGMDFNASGFIHALEKFAHIDETFGEFKEFLYSEVLHHLPNDLAADKDILSKYILDFYTRRGTEESIEFLLYILFAQKVLTEKRRYNVLIPSDKIQGVLSEASIVLQDNYRSMLYSYVLYLKDVPFGKYKDVLYKLVNPSGYLPFGLSFSNPVEIYVEAGSMQITIPS